MRDYYEDLWERLPDERELPDYALRLAFAREYLASGQRVLDLGCGSGDFTAAFAAAGAHALGAEVAENAITVAQRRHPDADFRLVTFDGELPFEDGAFDVVWASEVIEHVADTHRWVNEVRRVLSAGGRLLVTTPNHSRLRLLIGGIECYSPPLGDHLHLYSRRSLRELLVDFGFGDVTVRAAAGPPLFRRLLLGSGVRASL